ncbi:protein MAIN-LIKE 2-like [Camellia sinensis]|uniref:protein MAIN-LIKE 2-like n=1 Tax=Camellia sinensis TaxID=4442 RepID=UPI0010361512|nr:protein MAIN-LIKE 2-like [Camellia sinensis]
MRAETLMYGVLVERWWDTTDSFHFSSIGELTLTPYDFSMLTNLRVRVGGPIPYDPDMTQWRAAQRQFLKAISDITSHGMVRYSWFYDHFSESQPTTTDEVTQHTRDFLMHLLDTTLFANQENTMRLYLLGALVHLPQVTEYDWGGAGLATLHYYMSFVSCRKADSLGGYLRVWELWVYTYFTSLAPVPVRLIELSVPHSWLTGITKWALTRHRGRPTLRDSMPPPYGSRAPLAELTT